MASLLEDAEAVDDADQPQVRRENKRLAPTFYTKTMIILPRQARDKSREENLKTGYVLARRSWPGDDGRFTTRLAVNDIDSAAAAAVLI